MNGYNLTKCVTLGMEEAKISRPARKQPQARSQGMWKVLKTIGIVTIYIALACLAAVCLPEGVWQLAAGGLGGIAGIHVASVRACE